QDPNTLDQRDPGITFQAERSVNIEHSLCCLLLRLEDLWLGREAVVDTRLDGLLDSSRRLQRTLTHQHFLPGGAKLIKTVCYIENNLLMSRVEANVCHHQAFFRSCHHSTALTKIEQQPFRTQLRSIKLRLCYQGTAPGDCHII